MSDITEVDLVTGEVTYRNYTQEEIEYLDSLLSKFLSEYPQEGQ